MKKTGCYRAVVLRSVDLSRCVNNPETHVVSMKLVSSISHHDTACSFFIITSGTQSTSSPSRERRIFLPFFSFLSLTFFSFQQFLFNQWGLSYRHAPFNPTETFVYTNIYILWDCDDSSDHTSHHSAVVGLYEFLCVISVLPTVTVVSVLLVRRSKQQHQYRSRAKHHCGQAEKLILIR